MMRFTTADGLRLEYADQGAGAPVLCLPGLTRDLSDFDDLAAALPEVRLIRLSPRGRGGSDRATDPLQYNIPQEAADALALLDHLGLPSAMVIGTSRGGLLAMVIAATAPARLNGVVLNDIGPEMSATGLSRIMDYLGVTPKAQTLPDLVHALQSTMGAGFPDMSPARWQHLARRWFKVDENGIGLCYDSGLRMAVLAQTVSPAPDLWPLFDLLPAPVAVIRGANSDLLSVETVAKMRARRPALITATVPNRGHVPFLDEPESLAAIRAVIAQL